MNSHPVRFFHAFLSGAVIALLVALAILQIEPRAHATTEGSPPTSPAIPPLVPTAADLDGDGIPNTWETQFHHDPNNATDAGADFDNDGITTLQEYQLSVQTNGASGNPLGKWKFETAEVPAEVEGEYFRAVDINERGDFLVQILPLDIPALRTFFITHDTPEPLWTEVLAPGNPGMGTNMATDLNENRQIVGCYFPPNGSAQGYKWGTTNGAVPFLFGGQPAQAYKMNDRGDWVGVLKHAATGEWRPAHVVNGINLQLPNDWWTELSFTGINNYGEALGTYLNVASGSYRTFLAQGTWRYDTGLSGLMPTTDPTSSYWFWNAALNSYGEFTGAADVSDQQTTYAGYVFDGNFRRISLVSRNL